MMKCVENIDFGKITRMLLLKMIKRNDNESVRNRSVPASIVVPVLLVVAVL